MKSSINARFLKLYRQLPAEIRKQSREAYRLFKKDPHHTSLHFKKIAPNTYSARVTRNYRVVGDYDKDTNEITWFWIGSHTDYDKIISKRD